MPNKMAKFCKEKAVLISVYVEKPRKRRMSSNQRQHHHHHHHHHYLHHTNNQDAVIQYKNSGSGKGYNRRAELLRYSQGLRESARPAAASTVLLPKPGSPKNQQPATKTIAVHRRPNHTRTPTCLGNWKILMPSFIRSLISPKAKKDGRKKKKHSGCTTNKVKALMKSLQVQKKSRIFIPKLFSTLRKHR